MIYFSMPADFKKETINAYVKLNKHFNDRKVADTYGNITIDNIIESGRDADHIPKIGLSDLQEYVNYSHKNGIVFNYTINAPHFCNNEFNKLKLDAIYNFLYDLYSSGIRTLIVSSPPLIEFINSINLDFDIKASAICQIDTVDKALFYKNKRVDKIVIDESINRDFQKLCDIRKKFGEKIEVIVNSICYRECVYKHFHYSQIAFDSLEVTSTASKNFYQHRCLMQRYSNLSNILKMNWIRPEDLHYYKEIGICHFKIQGRHLILKSDPVKTVETYFKEKYSGDLMMLLNMFSEMTAFNIPVDNDLLDGFLDPFVKSSNFCSRNCDQCNYCDKFTEKAIDANSAKETIKYMEEFYSEYDQFSDILSSYSNTIPS